MIGLVWASAALIQSGAAAPPGEPDRCPARPDTLFAGISYRLEERARDGIHPVCPATRTPVDANADLVVTFVPPVSGDSARATEEQARILALLERIEAIGREVSQLNLERVDLTDSAAVLRFQEALVATTGRVAGMLRELKGLGLTSDEVVALSNQPGDAYVNLAGWLRSRIAALQRATEAFVASRDSVVVQVLAYRDPQNGKRVQLHVENYDDLPLGELRPIDRYGLALTPAERDRLRTELEGNLQIAGAIRRIGANADSLRREWRALAARVSGQLEQLLQGLGELPRWSVGIAGLRARLEELARGNPASAGALRALSAQLDSIRAALGPVDSAAARAGRLRTIVSAPGPAGFPELVAGEGGVFDLLGGLQHDLAAIPPQAELAGRHLERAGAALSALPATLGAELRGPVNLEALQRFITFARDSQLPATGAALEAIKGALELVGGKIIPAAEVLEDAAVGTPHALDDLPPATVELERAGWALGDRVTLVVRFSRRGDAGATAPGRVLHETTWRLDAVLMGGHREITSAVIFARAVTGSAEQRKWQPNVAALVSWHYYFRRPTSAPKRLWNAFDPAIGLHLANLDQADDNVEFGLGLNLTLWRGLLSGGYGYNLSRETGAYWFVGLNLFGLLDRSLR